MITETDEQRFWQKKEDDEQMYYLKWRHENILLKNALRGLARMREEYMAARKICQGYVGEDVSAKNLTEALSAAFILERHSVVSKEEAEKTINDYLSLSGKQQLKDWMAEKAICYADKPLSRNQRLSPISVARLAARMMGRAKPEGCYEVPEVHTAPMDLAIYFATQAQNKSWNAKSKQILQNLALDLTEQHIKKNSNGMEQNLIWKEMHDIIVKDNVSADDHIRFELIGRIGQRLGIDLEEKLLAARQEKLATKPKETETLKTLSAIQKRRHSFLGRLGLRRVHNVRG